MYNHTPSREDCLKQFLDELQEYDLEIAKKGALFYMDEYVDYDWGPWESGSDMGFALGFRDDILNIKEIIDSKLFETPDPDYDYKHLTPEFYFFK